jgi:hypothetical protein
MPFKLTNARGRSVDSPESMFLDLRTRKVPGLLAHQADVLREYVEKGASRSDVAFQLPTGSGKTLVGLLIAEWRRQKYGERVVYLCPTNQLVHQVVDQAQNKFGLTVRGFTGPRSEYQPGAKSDYQTAESIAITSYSALFNTNPFFSDPQVIVLDDAHAAESYIAGNWCLYVDRQDHSALYLALINVLRHALAETNMPRISGDRALSSDSSWVEKIPTTKFYGLIPEITELLDSHVGTSNLRYPWSMIRDHLQACHIYVSVRELLIRPLLPPTNTHAPFAEATQRIYMSATLGEGGELERITGRRDITRLHAPATWDKQTIGRRLFFFPQRSLDEVQTQQLMLEFAGVSGRALILVPDMLTAKKLRTLVSTTLGFTTYDAREIEQSKEAFVTDKQAVAIIANRYDGIDFPDDECRLIVVAGMPRATNLQERFLINKMGSVALLNDRILTRMVQAFGRCTRSATDFAAVAIWGDELHTFLQNKERRAFLHPELQAEIQFGIEQSKGMTGGEFLDNLRVFLNQTENWVAADEEIVTLRQSARRASLPGSESLRSIAGAELDYEYAIWHGDYLVALDNCRKILGGLNDPELRGYRALWNYLAGCAAWLASKTNMAQLEDIARDYFESSMKAAPAVSWLVSLARSEGVSLEKGEFDPQVALLVEHLEENLERLGTSHDRKYAHAERQIIDQLLTGTSGQFEEAHMQLGKLLGYDAGKKESPGSPDPWWSADNTLCFVFEDHSDASPGSKLSIEKARQVTTHPNWIRQNLDLDSNAMIVPVLVTPVSVADEDALPHLQEVYLWDLSEFQDWAQSALSVIRDLRRAFPGAGDLAWRATAIAAYRKNELDPKGLLRYFTNRPAASLLSPLNG